VVVDRDVHELAADGQPTAALGIDPSVVVVLAQAIADALAGAALDPAEPLDVDVHELARACALVADGWLEPEPAEPAQFDQDGRGIPGGMAEPDDHFGWALAAADFGRDKHADLAVGVPGDGPGATGSVVIIYSLSYGLRRYRAQRWSQGSAGIVGTRERNDQFGYALAAADFGKGARADLAIGVPLDRGLVGGVNLLFGSSKGLSAIGNGFVWQDGSSFQGDVEGDSESTDEFGRALTAANFGKGPVADLAIGVPGESKEGFFQRTKLAVGAVNVLYGDGYGLRWSDDQFWWQASDSLHDSAEVFDQFGSVLAH